MPMSKAASVRVARRIATAAAYGGGGLGLLGGAAVGLLFTEVQLAKRRVGVSDDEPPVADGLYGAAFARAYPGRPFRLAFVGDSTAAGQGVELSRQTPGGLLASALAAVAERPVQLRNVALSGAQSDDLERQISLLLQDGAEYAPDICVIMVGANDVTHRMSPARSVRLLSDGVARLRTAGCEVVVGTCPDLGTIEPVGQPLRWIARRLSRQLAAAQTIAVVEEGGRTVSLGSLLGPEFAANPRELFGPDQYHPSAEGYATAAMAVLPTLCAALGLWPTEEERPDIARREGVYPVARAAVEAVSEGGTEVAAMRGPWALLKRRRRRRLPPAEDVGPPHHGATPDATGPHDGTSPEHRPRPPHTTPDTASTDAGRTDAGRTGAGRSEAGPTGPTGSTGRNGTADGASTPAQARGRRGVSDRTGRQARPDTTGTGETGETGGDADRGAGAAGDGRSAGTSGTAGRTGGGDGDGEDASDQEPGGGGDTVSVDRSGEAEAR